jgi:phage terminase small subunit
MNKQSNDLTKKGTLNERQRKFAELYADSLNITRAYMEAYGTSETVASANGSRLLGNAKVNEYIQELLAEKRRIRILSVEEAQTILCNIAMNEKERSSDRINALDKLFKSKGQYFEGTKADTNINVTVSGATADWSK